MKKLFSITLLVLIGAGVSYGQKQAERWHFGQNAALNFNNDTVVAVGSSALNTTEGSASIADADGNLLFYTDGINVYDKTNTLITNGTGLNGSSSSTQPALFIPKPGNSNLTYLFTTDADGGPGGFSYSIVDVTLNEVTLKNELLADTMDEQIAGTMSNDGGYWVLSHKLGDDGFYAFKVTSAGINTTPVISHVGTVHNKLLTNANGQMKFSHDGTKLALGLGAQNILELYDFDAATGIVSNPITIAGVEKCYGVEFSGGSNMLYTAHYNSFFDTYDVDQYDITSGISGTIIGSKATITSTSDQLRQMQLAPNGKIYIAKAFQSNLPVINDPDSLGALSNYQDFAIDLDPDFFGYMSSLGLPNFLKAYLSARLPVAFADFDTSTCAQTCLNFTNLALDEVETWQWYFEGATPDTSTEANPQNICYNEPGNYDIMLIVGSNGGFDTLTLENAVTIHQLPVVNIRLSSDTLFASTGVQWQWYNNQEVIDNATDSFYVITSGAGSYTVGIQDTNSCMAFSSPFILTALEQAISTQVGIYPNPSTGSWQLSLPEAMVGNDIEIYNTSGQVIWKAEARNQKPEIFIPGAAQGIYMLRISGNGSSVTRKLVHL